MKNLLFFLPFLLITCTSEQHKHLETTTIGFSSEIIVPPRFFVDSSFWNQPLFENPRIHPKSDEWIAMMSKDPSGETGVGVNTGCFSIPIYEVNDSTPQHTVHQRVLNKTELDTFQNWEKNRYLTGRLFHGPGVPIPDCAIPDPCGDSHIAIIDRKNGGAWDMWGAKKDENGKWSSFTGMKYRLDGAGVFPFEDYQEVKNGETIHFYGPGKAAGVPAIAGTILHHETLADNLEYKIAGVSRYVAYREHIYPPAVWNDGETKGGIPEGNIIQLDPELDLSQFDLTITGKTVARALQKYGLILCDFAGGNEISAQNLNYHQDKTWVTMPAAGRQELLISP